MKQGTIKTSDGRTVGFADYGRPDQTAVVYCHGGPGNRLEPAYTAEAAGRAGLRYIGIDRPGYGLSTPQPGRTIGGWVSDCLAVMDHLGIDRFLTVGVSTGGSYALALPSFSPRVLGAVACCAVSDARSPEVRAMTVSCHPVWNVRSRDEAFGIVREIFGEHGERMIPRPPGADPSDNALVATPEFQSWWTPFVLEAFKHGLDGFVDDRLADKVGWGSFDVTKIACPVTVMHGTTDGLVPVATARHTAAIVPGATLRIFENIGHMSILSKVVEVIRELADRKRH